MRTFKGRVDFIGAASGTVAKARIVLKDGNRDAGVTVPADHELRFGDEVELGEDGKVRATINRPRTIQPGEKGNESGVEPVEVAESRSVEYDGLEVEAEWPSEPTPPQP